MGCAYARSTTSSFQTLMFRPSTGLVWVPRPPSTETFPGRTTGLLHGNRTVTITMKGWRFADGQVVNARSVMFFQHVQGRSDRYCGYNAGYGIPIGQERAGHANTVRINFTTSVNPNGSSTTTSRRSPDADRWDVSSSTQASTCASGTYGAASTDAACNASDVSLQKRLDHLDVPGAMWQAGDDGPWRLTASARPALPSSNPTPSIAVPKRPGSLRKGDRLHDDPGRRERPAQQRSLYRYIDPSVLSSRRRARRVGPNWVPLASHYSLVTGSAWSFNYAAFNFTSSDPNGAAVAQLYIRQAFSTGRPTQPHRKRRQGLRLTIDSPLPPRTPVTLSKPVANPYPFNSPPLAPC